MILELLVATLAVTWAWEALRMVIPWSLPSWLQPLIVISIAVAFCWPDWRIAMAVAGAVGVLHSVLTGSSQQSQAVTLRPGIGSRVPRLP